MKKVKFLFLALFFVSSVYGKEVKIVKNDSIVFEYLYSIKYMLDTLKVEEPVYVMAQALYESGWFACKHCTWENNNMFGFKGSNGKYLKFKCWQDCVIYYAKWQKKRYPKYKAKHPNGNYLDFLRWSNYSVSKDYAGKITTMKKWIEKNWH